jgi:hypothetical protein
MEDSLVGIVEGLPWLKTWAVATAATPCSRGCPVVVDVTDGLIFISALEGIFR